MQNSFEFDYLVILPTNWQTAMNGGEAEILINNISHFIRIPQGTKDGKKINYILQGKNVLVEFRVGAFLKIDYWNNKKGHKEVFNFYGNNYKYTLKKPIEEGDMDFLKDINGKSFTLFLGVYPKHISGPPPISFLGRVIRLLIFFLLLFGVYKYCAETNRIAEKNKTLIKYNLTSDKIHSIKEYKGICINTTINRKGNLSLLVITKKDNTIVGELLIYSNHLSGGGKISGHIKGNNIQFKDSSNISWNGQIADHTIKGTYSTPSSKQKGEWSAEESF